MNYFELVEYIKSFESDKEKLGALSKFIVDNVSYNYETLDNSKVSKYLIKNDPDSMTNLDNGIVAIQFICDLSKQLKLTNNYKNDMLKLYRYFHKAGAVSFLDIIPTSMNPVEYKENILKKGVCIQIANFFKQVCDDVGINCKVVQGNTGFAHAWNIVSSENRVLHYDCTYAMYAKDKYDDWDKKSKPEDWLGITQQQLAKLQPERTIDKYM